MLGLSPLAMAQLDAYIDDRIVKAVVASEDGSVDGWDGRDEAAGFDLGEERVRDLACVSCTVAYHMAALRVALQNVDNLRSRAEAAELKVEQLKATHVDTVLDNLRELLKGRPGGALYDRVRVLIEAHDSLVEELRAVRLGGRGV